jgi:hypothetical protein
MSKDVEHIFEKLRSGVVPQRGLETFSVGREEARREVQRQLALAAQGEGCFKFLRGGYGCGKTFMSRLAMLDAHAQNFAGAFVVVSENDLSFHKFGDVYRRIMHELSTAFCERQAFGDILDRWIGRVEESLLKAGADEDDPEFDAKVSKRMEEYLTSKTGQRIPQDMLRALCKIFELKQQRRAQEAGALLSWLCGSKNVDAGAKRLAGIKGDIDDKTALEYLRGVLEIVKAAGYRGLMVVIDEAETILRARKDVREKTLNAIRQIIDASDQYQGMFWVFTGTPDFYDSKKGVAALAPLHNRIALQSSGGMVSSRQPQLELKPFNSESLQAVALKLRELYVTSDRGTLERKITPELIRRLVERATQKFKGDVGVVPRQFLREFVLIMDNVNEFPDYDPLQAEKLQELEPNEHEECVLEGKPYAQVEPEDEQGYQELVVF